MDNTVSGEVLFIISLSLIPTQFPRIDVGEAINVFDWPDGVRCEMSVDFVIAIRRQLKDDTVNAFVLIETLQFR